MTQKPRPISVRPVHAEPHVHFERAAFATVFARAHDQDDSYAARVYPDDEIVAILVRAAQDPGSTSGWAQQLAQQATGAFLQSLAPHSAASALIARGIEVDLARFLQVTLPGRSGTPNKLPWVGENDPILVSRGAMTGTVVKTKKMGVIFAFSGELAKRASAQDACTALLREAAAYSLDAGYFSADAGDDVTHQGLLYGLSPVATTGDMTDDLGALAAAAATGGSGQVVFVTGPGRSATIAVRSPNLKIPVLPSLAVPEDRVIAVDPMSLAHGVGGEPEFSASNAALLHMDDDPQQIVASGVTAAPVRSLYQTDSIALSCLLDVGFNTRRSGAVAFMDGVYGW